MAVIILNKHSHCIYYTKSSKIVSLLCCLLMMAAAALCVNKEIVGSKPDELKVTETLPSDTITRMADGSIIIHTGSLTNADGYAGPVPLDISVSEDGVITDIEALPNAESPNFFQRASELFNSWIGKKANEVRPSEADAVTGATFSSNAIIANMESGIEYYRNDSLKDNGLGTMPFKMWVALVVTLAACIVPLFVKNKIYTTVQLVANVVVLGFWCGQLLDYALMLKYLSSGFSIPAGLTAIAMLIAAFIYPLFGHPQHYCNHICPFGSAQILMGKVVKYKVKLGVRLIKVLDWFRKILWAVLMLLLWCDVLTQWMDLELFQAFLYQSAPVGIIVAASAFLLLSMIVARPYCRFMCPTGSLFKRAENIG